jgi:hypothetical protein
MKVLSVLEDAELIIADLEVNLGDETHSSPTLCVRYQGSIIPLSTPDARLEFSKRPEVVEDAVLHPL